VTDFAPRVSLEILLDLVVRASVWQAHNFDRVQSWCDVAFVMPLGYRDRVPSKPQEVDDEGNRREGR